MCRINGIVDPALNAAELIAASKQMCDLMMHGGPDDEGIFVDEKHHLVFGHRRLSLLDLSQCGHQPMSYDNGRYRITYNGEIYNYNELKQELKQLGYTFKSSTDTEMIPAAFDAWGTISFTRFNGMFAFGLYDTLTSKMYLVRGPSGIKPLYYSVTGGALYFTSEVRAFKKFKRFQQQDDQSLIYLLAYGHLPEPITTLKGVKVLPKGSYLTFDVSNKKHDIEFYSHYNFSSCVNDKKTAETLIRKKLHAAVKRHLISDAPIGVFLSGGIDSSIIALLAAQNHTMLNTLSVYFDEGEYSEKKYQDILVEKIDCTHNQYLINEQEFSSHIPDVIKAMDLPSCDGVNTWFISKYAKQQGLKAVLSGIGGDEIFGGYPSFKRMKTLALLNNFPTNFLRSGRYTDNKKFKRLSYLSLKGTKGKYLLLRGQFIPSEIAALLNTSEEYVWKLLDQQPVLPDINYLGLRDQASWMEINMYMQNQLLRDSDVMSMAHGIELRVPFLDKEFLSAALSISPNVKYGGRLPKQLLIDTFKNILPEEIWNRPKMGFSFPFKEWMMNNEFVRSEMSKDKGFESMYRCFKTGKLHWSQLMTLLVSKQHFNA
ncbi:asparagine synthase (glutamine-hydrolyzing) [soil metagenome]